MQVWKEPLVLALLARRHGGWGVGGGGGYKAYWRRIMRVGRRPFTLNRQASVRHAPLSPPPMHVKRHGGRYDRD